jgi:hypothetical protein
MTVATLEQVLSKARHSSVEEYITYCESLTEITDSGTFEDVLQRNWITDVIELAPFSGIWPDETPSLRGKEGSRYVCAYQEPGAYIDLYEIIAVNVKEHKMWGYSIVNARLTLPQTHVEAVGKQAVSCFQRAPSF